MALINVSFGADKITTALLTRILDAVTRLENNLSLLSDAITNLTAKVAEEKTEIDSAIVFIKGVPALIDAAVAKALEAGATPEQLQALTDLSTGITDETGKLTVALATGTAPTV